MLKGLEQELKELKAIKGKQKSVKLLKESQALEQKIQSLKEQMGKMNSSGGEGLERVIAGFAQMVLL